MSTTSTASTAAQAVTIAQTAALSQMSNSSGACDTLLAVSDTSCVSNCFIRFCTARGATCHAIFNSWKERFTQCMLFIMKDVRAITFRPELVILNLTNSTSSFWYCSSIITGESLYSTLFNTAVQLSGMYPNSLKKSAWKLTINRRTQWKWRFPWTFTICSAPTIEAWSVRMPFEVPHEDWHNLSL